MTQLVFALVVTMGAQTISVEHWAGIKTAIKTALKTASPILEALDREWHQALFTTPEGPCGCACTFIS